MHSVVDFFCCNAWFHHLSCDVEDFSCQLQVTYLSNSNCNKWKTKNKNHGNTITRTVTSNTKCSKIFYVTLHTTLMLSMSSGQRILICDVPFRNCSDSDIPVGRKHNRQLELFTCQYSLKLMSELKQDSAKQLLSVYQFSDTALTVDHHSWIYILLIDSVFPSKVAVQQVIWL